MQKEPGAYWTDEEIKQAIEEWRKIRPKRVKDGNWQISEMPFYEPGRPNRADLWHRVDYLDEYDMIWPRKWGASGIGKLREVGVVRPSEADLQIFMKQDPAYMNRPRLADTDRWAKEHGEYVRLLKENGVTVHYIEYPPDRVGPYGPIKGKWGGAEPKVVWGGVLVGRFGFSPHSKGKERFLSEWLVSQGCPILLSVTGKGICETGCIMSLTDDCVVFGRGMAFNEEGVRQVKPVLENVGITTFLEVHISSWLEVPPSPDVGSRFFHPDMFMMPVDLGKVVINPAFCGWETIRWFRDNKFELIPIPDDEQRHFIPSNLMILEPGKVIMNAAAKETIKRVRKAGVEVIELQYEEGLGMGGGIYCCTLQMLRDPGPKLADIK